MPRLPFQSRLNIATAIGLFDGVVLGFTPFFSGPDFMHTQCQIAYGLLVVVVVLVSWIAIERINR